MDIVGLDSKIYKWNPINSEGDFTSCSSYHSSARVIIKQVFPFDIILEEVSLPGTRTRAHDSLRADFYLPKRKIMIEIHGEQHYKQNSMFHADESEFKIGQLKDRNKRLWCEQNNINYVELPYNHTKKQWENALCQAK